MSFLHTSTQIYGSNKLEMISFFKLHDPFMISNFCLLCSQTSRLVTLSFLKPVFHPISLRQCCSKSFSCRRTPLIKPVFHGLCTVFPCYYEEPHILNTFVDHLKIERLPFMQCCQMLHGNDEAQLQH